MSDISISDILGDTLAFVVGVVSGIFANTQWLMIIMLAVCSLAILIRKGYNTEFSEYWDYLFVVTLPLGICIGRILWLTGVI